MTQGGTSSTLGRAVAVGYVAACAVATLCYLSASPVMRSAIAAGISLTPVVAVLVSFRINKIFDRLPWLLIVLGMLNMSAVNAVWLVTVGLGISSWVDPSVTIGVQMSGYLSMLAATMIVVFRHAPENLGGVIDAALTGLGVAAPIWEFLIRPRMLESNVPVGSHLVVLVQLLVLLAVLGSLLRISRTSGRGVAALRFLVAAMIWTVAGFVLSAFATATAAAIAATAPPRIVGLCWVLACLSLTAGAIHPTAAQFTRPVRGWCDVLSPVRLARLGFFLVLIPLVGGVQQIFGGEPDGILLSLGPLLATPLVLTRIGQLVAQRTQDQSVLAHQATHDELTGLPNRRRLFTLAAEACARCEAGELDSLAILYCDLDGFKPVNDRHGHEAGDEILRVVGRRLVASVRAEDVVGRLGGDEFLILCPGARRSEADALRDRVRAAVADPVAWRDTTLRIGVTVGVSAGSGATARLVGDGVESTPVTVDDLVAAADRDMYARKSMRVRQRAPEARLVDGGEPDRPPLRRGA
ncbi:MAG: GGDEF domain-containing protein [Dactylosporangium sp.]|nr:GGDEF domain-containing protein [Dactylosporangium sp.]NNJ59386.1 GGDEF domain-containing protein [Dactylosporangium sp.]